MPINTTAGPVERAPGAGHPGAGHVINTSRAVEEDMEYLDEEPEIIAVLPAVGWYAIVGEQRLPLAVFVAMDDARLYGVVVGESGRVDLSDAVEKDPGFARYEQANTNTKENEDV